LSKELVIHRAFKRRLPAGSGLERTAARANLARASAMQDGMMKAKSIGLLAAGLIGGLALALSVNDLRGEGALAAQEAAELARSAGGQPDRVVPGSASQVNLSFAPVARAVQPAVVNIFTARVVRQRQQMGPFFSMFEGQPRVENSLGSGVIVDAGGLVITNNHVVAGADQILVALADRREYPAKLLFAEPRLDLALLKIEPAGCLLYTSDAADDM
jgi:S1-C subfamily serine protease